MSNYNLWCYIEEDIVPFCIAASSATTIGRLKEFIKERGKTDTLSSIDVKDLTLWKVRYLLVTSSDITNDITLAYGGYPCWAI